MTELAGEEKKSLHIVILNQNGLDYNLNTGPKVYLESVIKKLKNFGNTVVLLFLQTNRRVLSYEPVTDTVSEKNLGLSGNKLFTLIEGAIRYIQNLLHLPYLGLFDSYRFREACINHYSDCDLFYERYTEMSYGGVWAASKLKKPLVLQVDADSINLEAPLHGKKYGRMQHLLAEWSSRLCFDNAMKIVVISKPAKDRLVDYWNVPAEKIEVVPNGADIGLFNSEIDASDVARRLNIRDEKIIVFTGSFQAWHGTRILIEAFRKVVKEVPNSKLLLVGDGPIKQENEQRVRELGLEDDVIFTGDIAHAEVPKYLKIAQVCAAPYEKLPSELWFSPLKLFEYMAMGKAVVASDAGQISEALEDGKSGLLFEPGDIEALSEALIKLLTNQDLCLELGKNARKTVLEAYTWEKQCRRLENIMYSIYDES